MTNLFLGIVDFFKGKERADWVVQSWLRDHADEYKNFVAGIDKMAEGDMSTAFEMYKMMKECMPPEAEQYYDMILRLFSGDQNALMGITKLEHANEIGECTINGKMLEINIGNGEIRITDSPRSGYLIVNVSNLMGFWDSLPLYNKAYCKDQYERILSTMPKAMQKGLYDSIINLVRINYVANLVFMPGMMANLYDKAVNGNNGMLFAMYYFVTYDHGLQRMAEVFSKVVTNETPDIDGVTVFKSTIYRLAHTSISNGWDSKEEWKNVAEEHVNDEAWKEIMFAVRNAKSKHGKPTEQKFIDDLLKCRNKDAAKALMIEFLKEQDGLYGLAFLRWVLDRTGCIRDVSYMVYHRAMEVMLDKQINFKKPQERYGLLNNQFHEQENHVRIWKQVDRIMKKWQPRFEGLK